MLSSRLTEVRWGVWFDLLSHPLHVMTLGGGGIQYESVSRFQASLCWDFPVQRVGFVCFLFGFFYSSTYISTLVGLTHPVIARHALLSSESSSLEKCADLVHTGATYSVTE